MVVSLIGAKSPDSPLEQVQAAVASLGCPFLQTSGSHLRLLCSQQQAPSLFVSGYGSSQKVPVDLQNLALDSAWVSTPSHLKDLFFQ